jgi:hypothetical protein
VSNGLHSESPLQKCPQCNSQCKSPLTVLTGRPQDLARSSRYRRRRLKASVSFNREKEDVRRNRCVSFRRDSGDAVSCPWRPEAASGVAGRREAKDLDAAASSASCVRCAISFRADRPAPPSFTNACTSARGHLGSTAPPTSCGARPTSCGRMPSLGCLLLQRTAVLVLTVEFHQPSHEFTFGVGKTFVSYPLVLTPVV